jgi:integrase
VPIPAEFSKDEAQSFANDLTEELDARGPLTRQEYERLKNRIPGQLRKAPARRIDHFVRRVYLATREKLASYRAEDIWWEKYILPHLGEHDVSTFGPDPIRELVADLDARVEREEISWKTADNVWVVVKAFCKALCSSKSRAIRVRKDNPTDKVEGPDRGVEKTKQWLYPRELHALCAYPETDLELARFCFVSVALVLRPGEALGLDWEHSIDLEHNMVKIDCAIDERNGELRDYTKSKEIREFPIPEHVRPLLEAMRKEQGGQGRLFSRSKKRPVYLHEALKAAGINRPGLFKTTLYSRAIRLHDMRGTGISYLALAGVDDWRIRSRAGHKDIQTTLIYVQRGREAVGSGTLGDPVAPPPDRLLGTGHSAPESAPADESGADSIAPAVGLEATTCPPDGGFTGVFEGSDSQDVPKRGAFGTLGANSVANWGHPNDSADRCPLCGSVTRQRPAPAPVADVHPDDLTWALKLLSGPPTPPPSAGKAVGR